MRAFGDGGGEKTGEAQQRKRLRNELVQFNFGPRTAAPRERRRDAAPLSAATAALSQATLWQRRDKSHSASVCVRVCVPLFFSQE